MSVDSVLLFSVDKQHEKQQLTAEMVSRCLLTLSGRESTSTLRQTHSKANEHTYMDFVSFKKWNFKEKGFAEERDSLNIMKGLAV